MSAKKYRIASQEGLDFYLVRSGPQEKPVKIGDEVALELDSKEQELALIAAAWLEHPEKKEA